VDALSANPAAGVLSIVQAVLQLVALMLVFQTSARPWFRKSADAAAPA
jgi:hypothetical protein